MTEKEAVAEKEPEKKEADSKNAKISFSEETVELTRGEHRVILPWRPGVEPDKLRAFGREFHFYLNCLQSMQNALGAFETGQADYRNAAENVKHLRGEIEKLELEFRGNCYSRFLPMVAQVEDSEVSIVEDQIFGADAIAFITFIGDTLRYRTMTQDQEKNS